MDDRFVSGTTIRTENVSGRLFRGLGAGAHPGVLVLHGGGGARGYEQTYAAMLAEHGYTAFCVEYFGAPGIRKALLEVPLEEFGAAAEWLLARPDVRGEQVGVVGFSRGGEASLLVGSHFEEIGCVVSYVPSGYVWPAPGWMDGVDREGLPAWTLNGEAAPSHPLEKYVYETDGIDAELGVNDPDAVTLAFERSTDQEKKRAMIPVEEIDGPVLLISGGEDTVWPSKVLAERAADRLAEHDHDWQFEHRCFPDAGHTIRVPYRFGGDSDPNEIHQYGGTRTANARASARAWKTALQYLGEALQNKTNS